MKALTQDAEVQAVSLGGVGLGQRLRVHRGNHRVAVVLVEPRQLHRGQACTQAIGQRVVALDLALQGAGHHAGKAPALAGEIRA